MFLYDRLVTALYCRFLCIFLCNLFLAKLSVMIGVASCFHELEYSVFAVFISIHVCAGHVFFLVTHCVSFYVCTFWVMLCGMLLVCVLCCGFCLFCKMCCQL